MLNDPWRHWIYAIEAAGVAQGPAFSYSMN